MLSYRELLKQTKDEIAEVDARAARDLTDAQFVDVRERGRVGRGSHPGRGARSARQSRVAHRGRRPRPRRSRSSSTAPPARARPSPRRRSASSATRTSSRSRAASPTGSGTATTSQLPRMLSPEKRARYSRHLAIPEIGEEGQLKLLDSKVLLLGAGGLGSPAALYLAAAGVGHLGIIDADIVDESNLQRQIAHSLNTLGSPKVDSAKRAIEALNPDVEVDDLPRAPHLREHRADPRRRLGDHRRRHRQLPHALPRERRVGLARHPRRPRLDLPLRGPGDGLQAGRRPVLPLPLPRAAAARARAVVRRGRRARRAAGHRRHAADERGAQARARHRRAADRPAAPASTRSRPTSTRCRSSATRTAPSAASTRRSPSTSTTSSSARGERLRRRRLRRCSGRRPAARARSRRPARPCASCSRT